MMHCQRACLRARREHERQARLPPAIRTQRREAAGKSPFPPVAAWAAARATVADAGDGSAGGGYWVLRGEDGRQALQRLLSGAGAGERLLQQALVRVDVRMCGPGVPAEGDAVCFPLPADALALRSRVRPSDTEDLIEGDGAASAAAASRPVVGYVTSGGFGARRGIGVGTAFVSAMALVGLFRVSGSSRAGAGTPRDALVMIQCAAGGSSCRAALARPRVL